MISELLRSINYVTNKKTLSSSFQIKKVEHSAVSHTILGKHQKVTPSMLKIWGKELLYFLWTWWRNSSQWRTVPSFTAKSMAPVSEIKSSLTLRSRMNVIKVCMGLIQFSQPTTTEVGQTSWRGIKRRVGSFLEDKKTQRNTRGSRLLNTKSSKFAISDDISFDNSLTKST